MRNSRFARQTHDEIDDPREGKGAEIIDLATRHVLPEVARPARARDGLIGVAGVALVIGLGAVTFLTMDAHRISEPAPTGGRIAPVAVAPGANRPAAQGAPLTIPPDAITPLPMGAPVMPLPPINAVASAPQPGAQIAPLPNPRGAPTLVFDASASAAAQALALPGGPAPMAAPTAQAGDEFSARVGGVGGNAATATASLDPRYTVTQGTFIPAILETAIDTDVPGFTRAVVSADVRSFDGSRVLVPRSSRLIGQYKSGLQAGQKRAYVIWTRLIRPDGVSVNLGSPAVTFGGETGLAGKVNTHFFERFGSAMLLSVIGGLSAIGSGGLSVITGGGQSAAAAAVGQTGNIGPTIKVRQGEPIRVFTARDLDFSKVGDR